MNRYVISSCLCYLLLLSLSPWRDHEATQSTDPSQKNTQLILKFLPFMIGYFSLSVPSGLSMYWFTNNVLSTAQIWLRKLGGAKPAVNEGASGIITAGRAKRSSAQSGQGGERFKQLKQEENRRKAAKALAAGDSTVSASTSEDEASDDETTEEGGAAEETYIGGSDKKLLLTPERRARGQKGSALCSNVDKA